MVGRQWAAWFWSQTEIPCTGNLRWEGLISHLDELSDRDLQVGHQRVYDWLA